MPADAATSAPRDFVPVHGAWHGGRSRERAQFIVACDVSGLMQAGHSYGTMTIATVAGLPRDRTAHILWLDHALPGSGERMISCAAAPPAEAIAATGRHHAEIAAVHEAMPPGPETSAQLLPDTSAHLRRFPAVGLPLHPLPQEPV